MIRVTSSAFNPGEPIPQKYSGEGDDVSPPLGWSGVPDGAKELALVCDDPDAPKEEPWVHWVLYKIPADSVGLEEDDAGGAVEGLNDWDRPGYGGPMPPTGHGTHHYHFKLYALDQPVDLKPGATKQELLKAIKPHVMDEGELVGTYERK